MPKHPKKQQKEFVGSAANAVPLGERGQGQGPGENALPLGGRGGGQGTGANALPLGRLDRVERMAMRAAEWAQAEARAENLRSVQEGKAAEHDVSASPKKSDNLP
ncbi:hypothetical protein DFQ26_002015 [Actinomortierella ambigua]|nr:hypothetical protein DFQ26_002015 [Actinomortierella ambigua]